MALAWGESGEKEKYWRRFYSSIHVKGIESASFLGKIWLEVGGHLPSRNTGEMFCLCLQSCPSLWKTTFSKGLIWSMIWDCGMKEMCWVCSLMGTMISTLLNNKFLYLGVHFILDYWTIAARESYIAVFISGMEYLNSAFPPRILYHSPA